MTGAIFLCHSCQGERERESMPPQARNDTIMLPCHCERSEAISDGLPRAHALAMTEVGRSMVEMLGVLAMMGIVGLVGVRMYTNAMNKHRANELIYEAQKRATMVAMQITAGQENLSVANFTNPTGYTFGVEKNPQNANQFNITVTGVDSKVCEHMKTAVGSATPIRVISEFCDTLTFNNDLSTAPCTTDYATNQNACEAAGYTWCLKGDNVTTPKCSTTSDCCVESVYDTECQTCDKTTGKVTNKGTDTTCLYKNKESTCRAGTCLDPDITNSTPCLTNNECGGIGSGYYCKYPQISTNVCTEDGMAALGCTEQTLSTCPKGTCTLIGNTTKTNLPELGKIIVSYTAMNWWSAKNWCEAQGKELIDVETLKAYVSGTNKLMITSNNTGGAACAKEKTCEFWNNGKYSAIWAGNSGTDQNTRTLTDAKDESGELYRVKFSSVVIALARQFRELRNTMWTGSNLKASDFCKALYLNVHIGGIGSIDRNNNNTYSPLCL